MKQDLDCLMEERGLDAALVVGTVHGNPAMYYMTNGAGLTRGWVLKKRGEEPVLLCSPMEREEAAASGLAVVNMGKYDFTGILREKGDRLAAAVELHRRVFADLDVGGRVGFYGLGDQGRAWVLLNALDAQLEGIEVYGDFDVTPIDAARATKDGAEAERIREIGQRTCGIIGQTVEFLKSHRVKDEALVQADSTPLTIGRVHEEINRFIAEQRLEDPEGFIFAIGRDAGIPHNKGNHEDVVALGQTIVFDIFPREAGGGYFADVTRTFCLGYAPPEVEKAYRDVYECQAQMLEAYEVGTETRRYQQMACEFFESRGHPTIASDTKTEEGYVHGLGHGLGLAIHEEPRFSDTPDNTDVLRPGHVFTCEPGLYYPDRGFGMRIEDDIWIDPDGGVHNLTDFPKELVI
ncbi:MAG: aminopeptidase P family protein, partial [Chloroflexi bacterium]|nr:aminopeptidase P family protein [Chloroflexota bacterium]